MGAGRVLATRGRRSMATPVIVRKGAIAPNTPHSDLRVTRAHSLYLDGALIPVEFLVNHRSILWDDDAREVSLYQIELETHDVLLANGAPAESYRDDGNRWLFQNGNTGWDQPPKPPCAEVLTGGPIVDALWLRLLDRAGARPRRALTDDPDLHLLVDGRRLDAMQRTDSYYVFALPTLAARCVRIASRAAAPAELGLARDPRVLGIALSRIVVRAGNDFRIVDVTDDRLAEGFHGYEADGERRWTDGDALLPIELFTGFGARVEVVLHLCGTTQYLAVEGAKAEQPRKTAHWRRTALREFFSSGYLHVSNASYGGAKPAKTVFVTLCNESVIVLNLSCPDSTEISRSARRSSSLIR